ncbi:hypothetical protein ACR80S_01805 [Halomonas sp. MA07-2]|uniref:hypothetical protein n=1 Tax=Halomonas sp. MA07-2 TaxID=3440841 RepID=UPI003EEA7361
MISACFSAFTTARSASCRDALSQQAGRRWDDQSEGVLKSYQDTSIGFAPVAALHELRGDRLDVVSATGPPNP